VALFKHVFSRRYLSIVSLIVTYSLLSFAISQAADAPGTKGPIGTTGKTTPGVTGPVKGTTPSKLKSDIIVINAPVKKVSGAKGSPDQRVHKDHKDYKVHKVKRAKKEWLVRKVQKVCKEYKAFKEFRDQLVRKVKEELQV
jgi:hypothetical protein